MKKIIALIALMLTTAAIVPVEAQNINININIDRQPAWGPIGYNYVDFYYFPDINVYYDVNYGMFYYTSRGRWVSAHYLPAKYSRYDLYGMYKVVLTGRDPWISNKVHRRQYAQYKNNRTQVVIRNSNDTRYRTSRSNHVPWVQERTSGSARTTTGRTGSATNSNSRTTTSRTTSTPSTSTSTSRSSSSGSGSSTSRTTTSSSSSRTSSENSSGTATSRSSSSGSSRTNSSGSSRTR